MKKILILYYSGTGNTRGICKVFEKYIIDSTKDVFVHTQDIFSFISPEQAKEVIQDHDLLIIASPVYKIGPSGSMNNFIENLPKFKNPVRCFIIMTKTGIAGNATKVFFDLLKTRNIITYGWVEFFSLASDRSLKVLPKKIILTEDEQKKIIRELESYETIHKWPFRWATSLFQAFSLKNRWAAKKLAIKKVKKIIEILYSKEAKPIIKLHRWNTGVMKWLDKVHFTHKEQQMHILSRPENCKLCKKCIVLSCPNLFWGNDGTLKNSITCPGDACMMCVHKCPHRNIIHAGMKEDGYIEYRLTDRLVKNAIRFFFEVEI